MKRVFTFSFLIIFLLQTGLSQERNDSVNRILFRGLVMDASTLSPLSNSQIVINRIFSSISGSDGTFAFYVFRNDTVVFSNLGYKPAVLYVSDTLIASEFITGVYMHTDTLAIGEVVIVPQFPNLKSEIMNARSKTPEVFNNAKYNVAVSAYQARNSQGSLGTADDNYAAIMQQQKDDAYSKGMVPSDKIAAISPLLLVPVAYLLMHGTPEKPVPMKQPLTGYEVDQIHKKYLKTHKKRDK